MHVQDEPEEFAQKVPHERFIAIFPREFKYFSSLENVLYAQHGEYFNLFTIHGPI